MLGREALTFVLAYLVCFSLYFSCFFVLCVLAHDVLATGRPSDVLLLLSMILFFFDFFPFDIQIDATKLRKHNMWPYFSPA